MTNIIIDLETFLMDDGDRIFRYWVYKKMFTPYEQENKFIDESIYVDSQCSFGIIRECIELLDKDVLLGIQQLYDEIPDEIDNIQYYKLSEIKLEYRPSDREEFMNDF